MSSKRLHLEITSRCTLICHACPRTIYSALVHANDLPISIIKDLVVCNEKFDYVVLCGNHGEPIYHKNFHEVLELLIRIPHQPQVIIATNGAHRNKTWWEETAHLLRPQDLVIFGVDGLKDSNHLYRKNANWESIDLAIKTLKKMSECKIMWQWILFKYNENQLSEAARQSHLWGVDQFLLIESFRDHLPGFAPTQPLNQALEIYQNAAKNLSKM